VNDTTKTIATSDTNLAAWQGHDSRPCRPGRHETEAAVRLVAVVMVLGHVEHVFKVRLVDDQQPIETLRANCAYEPLRPAAGREMA
jgi:hypothetical protein